MSDAVSRQRSVAVNYLSNQYKHNFRQGASDDKAADCWPLADSINLNVRFKYFVILFFYGASQG